MLRLRLLLVSLIGWLAILYNIERVQESLNIATFVYVLIFALSFVLFLAPRAFAYYPVATSAILLAIYGILKVSLGYPIAGAALPITIVEIGSLLLTILLLRYITIILVDFEDTVANITINLLGIPPRLSDNDLEEVYREVRRARRFKHPITLAVVQANYNDANVDINQVVQEIQRGMRNSFLQARLIRLLSNQLNESDIIVRTENELILAMPHVSPESARRLFEAINLQTMQWGLPLNVGFANFPETGTTLQTLIEAAAEGIEPLELRLDSLIDQAMEEEEPGEEPLETEKAGRTGYGTF